MKRSMPWREVAALITLLAAAAVLLLPALPRARESAKRNSCANNLKQMGIVCAMYRNENRGGKYPPRSTIPDNWIIDTAAVYPEYLTDLSVLICPSSPVANSDTFTLQSLDEHPFGALGERHPDCVSPLFYNYTGYIIYSDEQAWALFNAIPNAMPDGDLEAWVPEWTGSGRTGEPGNEGIPVLWDRPALSEQDFSHRPLGLNVLHHDGHVEFIRYSPWNRSNNFPATRLAAETFGSSLPQLSRDCY